MVRDRLVSIVENLAPTPIAWLAIVVGVFVHLASFFLFKIEVPGMRSEEETEAYVSFVTLSGEQADQNLREKALLADSVPLFLPSEVDYAWNQMQPSFYDNAREANLLEPYQMNFDLDPGQVLTQSSDYSNLVPEDLLALEMVRVFTTFGEKPLPKLNLNPRFGNFQFRTETTREVFSNHEIIDTPSTIPLGNYFWKPGTVLVLVSQTGSVGKPILRESTGVVEIDQFMIKWVEAHCNSNRVSPGYYAVTFGP